MVRSLGAVAVACLFAVGLHAQDAQVQTKTKVKADDAKPVTFTGCLQTGTEASAFVLAKAVPVSQTTTMETATGTSGKPETTTTTVTTYVLVPNASLEFQPLIGHKVEVTGVIVKAASGGDDDAKVKTTTETKTKTENEPDKKVKEESKMDISRGPVPQLKVISIKHLADACEM
jgi:hypothetical protein